MMLLTPELRARLIANNHALRAAQRENRREPDHVPVVKFFNPCGAATWLFSDLDPDGDRLFGLADLGFGAPELGYVSLSELASIRLPLGLGIERDLHFEGRFPLSRYADAARRTGSIMEGIGLLHALPEGGAW